MIQDSEADPEALKARKGCVKRRPPRSFIYCVKIGSVAIPQFLDAAELLCATPPVVFGLGGQERPLVHPEAGQVRR